MFSEIQIKQEFIDTKDRLFHTFHNENHFSYESSLESFAISESSDCTPPPKKKKKIKAEFIDKSYEDTKDPRLKKRFRNSFQEILISVPNVDIKECCSNDKSEYTWKLSSTPLYDNVLQELFQWSPDWLQGSAQNKPPVSKFEYQIKKNPFKYEYTHEEYISRHLPYILKEVFIKLSETFKNEAPSRWQHNIFINDCKNSGHSELNKMLVCYSERDFRKTPKPIAKVNDIVIITMSVLAKDGLELKKKYFGIITSHSMIEYNEVDKNIIREFESNANFGTDKSRLLWDRLTIVTKRALNSTIKDKSRAQIDILMNISVELKLIQNLIRKSWKCTKLLSNIFEANGNVHQFSSDELKDSRIVWNTLIDNAIEMQSKSNPMIFVRGINNLMVVDITDDQLRLKYLCDIAIKCVEKTLNGKFRVLVITNSEQSTFSWKNRMLNICGPKSSVRYWALDSSRGWTRHYEVVRFVKRNARYLYEELASKLKDSKDSDGRAYREQLIRNKDIYRQIMSISKSNPYPIRSQNLSASLHITREELNEKGYELHLSEKNIIIGTLTEIFNCRQLFSEKSKKFDCCIFDDCHLFADTYSMSVINLGINTIIIGGDSEQTAINNPETNNCLDDKYDMSLFERVIRKCLNFK